MTYFQDARNISIYESLLMDVQGDLINVAGGSVSVQHGDPLLQILYQATATGAAYDSQERHPPPKCQLGTREGVLDDITSWIRNGTGTSGSGSVMWLHGPAGAGKSAIAQTICELSANRRQLAASFFFSRGHSRRGRVDSFVATLAFQLTTSGSELLRRRVVQAVRQNPFVVHAVMAVQMENLVAKPLRSLFEFTGRTRNDAPYVIVVDGIDECAGNNHQNELLDALLDLVRVRRLPLYILIVSRPEPHIENVFKTTNMQPGKCRILSLYGDYQAHVDICSYLRKGFNEIHNAERHSAIMQSVQKPWPSDSVIKRIADKSGGYFIYASTVLKFVDEEYSSPVERIQEVVDESSRPSSAVFAELDKLYAQILRTCPNQDLLKRILGCIFLRLNDSNLRRDLSFVGIALRLGIQPSEIMLALRGLRSLLSIQPEVKLHSSKAFEDPRMFSVRSIHASLRDFLLNEERAGAFYVDAQDHYKNIVLTCWKYFSSPSNAAACPEDVKVLSSLGLCFPYFHLHIPTNEYLLDCFNSHWSRILDKSQVVKGLKGASSSTWMPLIKASNGWPVQDKHMLSITVDAVITGLECLVSQPEDLIAELSSLLDTIYLNHLSPQSTDDILLIQGIWTMFSISVYVTKGYEDFLDIPRSPHRAYIVEYLRNNPSISPWHASLFQFMSDPERCGVLFADPETRHSRLALCCIKELTNTSPHLYDIITWPGDMSYARDFFVEHLSYAPLSGVDKVQAYLRSLDLVVTFSGLARAPQRLHVLKNLSAVLTWLESLLEPPMDIILPWSTFYKILLGTTETPAHTMGLLERPTNI